MSYQKASQFPIYNDMLHCVAQAGLDSLPVLADALAFTRADYIRKPVIILPEDGCSRGGAIFCRDVKLDESTFPLLNELVGNDIFAGFDENGWIRKLADAHVQLQGFADLTVKGSKSVIDLRGNKPEDAFCRVADLDKLSGEVLNGIAEFRTGYTYCPEEATPILCFSALSLKFSLPETIRYFLPIRMIETDIPETLEEFKTAMGSVVLEIQVPSLEMR